MIDIGEDAGMALKTEYCGKIQYMDGGYGSRSREKDLVIEIFMAEDKKEQSH